MTLGRTLVPLPHGRGSVLGAVFGALGFLIALGGCSDARRGDWVAVGREAMVATDHALASRAGVEVLRAGGNAVDAAIAVSLALAVVRSESTGLGGGGFMIVRLADGNATVLDYRETAPSAADAEMFTRAQTAHPGRAPPSRLGHLAVGVPGQLAGLAEAHRRWGTRTWEELTAPARRWADVGFAVDKHYADAAADVLERYTKYPELKASCPYVFDVHLRRGQLPSPGDVLRQPALLRLMQAIAVSGPDAVRQGLFADALAREMAARGGMITRDDVAGYQVAERAALRGRYRDFDILTMPPPSSGGVCLLETLNILEAVRQRDGNTESADGALAKHYLLEAMKHAFADRSRWLGDSDFVEVPTDLLTSQVYAATLAEGVRAGQVAEIDTYGAIAIPDDGGTSHFCIVDRWGNAVVSTETINGYFGSLAAIAEWGVILNNEMDDFTAVPGTANLFDLAQSPRNAVAPRKRPLSSMTPTIVLRDGEPVLLIGGSGGPRIISAVLNVMLNVVDRQMPLADAMRATRVHHQWRPDAVYFDRKPPAALRRSLEQRGHRLSTKRKRGMVQCIRIVSDPTTSKPAGAGRANSCKLIGASDPRKGGQPEGY